MLGGKYRLVARLGSGGMGSVWHAEHLTLTSPVAIKLIDPAAAREPDTLHRFLREARTAAALRSPHVVQIFDYGVDGDTPYIVMEMLDGESLADRVARLSRLSTSETARVIQHISRALARAHEAGIVHRDLKPENVFIVKNDDEEIAKVLDFGIVKADPNAFDTNSPAAATRTGTLLGTPYFMSPEQAESSKLVDHRADIWALGVIAYRCLIGALPFNGDSVGRLILEICSRPLPVPSQRGSVPAGFDAWFARACARDPRARFESAKRAAAELTSLTEGASMTPVPSEGPPGPPGVNPIALRTTTLESSNTEVLTSPRRPRRLALVLALCAVMSLAVALGVSSRSSSRPPPAAPSSSIEQRHQALEGPAREAVAGAPGSSEAQLAPPTTAAPPSQPLPTAGPAPAHDLAPNGTPASEPVPPSGPTPPPAAAPAAPPRAPITKPPERKPPPPPKPKVDLGI